MTVLLIDFATFFLPFAINSRVLLRFTTISTVKNSNIFDYFGYILLNSHIQLDSFK